MVVANAFLDAHYNYTSTQLEDILLRETFALARALANAVAIYCGLKKSLKLFSELGRHRALVQQAIRVHWLR